jgi:quercetin dioxygenase-like cupin family protein
VLDWHPAPRRQFVITLTGEVEYEIGDGTRRRFGPGSIFLAEDLTGQGHIARGVGSRERTSVYIAVDEIR